jgi:mannose-6-phosphate isomerase-like protein (cupin superfamily)
MVFQYYGDAMSKMPRYVLMTSLTCLPVVAVSAQFPKAATYITDEEIKTVNRSPGIDRNVRVVDIGYENLAVGVVHRVPGGARSFTPIDEPCGEQSTSPQANAVPGGVTHDSQTEVYYIISGGGTLITGGHLVNGRRYATDSDVNRVLNGPSCGGMIVGSDVVKRAVKTGDVIIIPPGVPHAWADVTDHVDYLSVRPSQRTLEPGYVHPSIRKPPSFR